MTTPADGPAPGPPAQAEASDSAGEPGSNAAGGVPPAAGAAPTRPRRRSRRRRRKGQTRGSFVRELPILVVIAVGLALLFKTFLVQAFFIPSASMEQTLHVNDRVLVNKLVYHFRTPHRGEIVVFNTAGTRFASDVQAETSPAPTSTVGRAVNDVDCFLGIGCAGQTDFIKRVIGVPGDHLKCCNARDQVVLNGVGLVEPYVYPGSTETAFCAGPSATGPPRTGTQCTASSPPVVVGKGMLFVMGDHRDDSDDSRVFGQLPEEKVIGRAFMRIWPLDRIAFLRVPSTIADHAAGSAGVAGAGVAALPMWLRRRRRRRRAALR